MHFTDNEDLLNHYIMIQCLLTTNVKIQNTKDFFPTRFEAFYKDYRKIIRLNITESKIEKIQILLVER